MHGRKYLCCAIMTVATLLASLLLSPSSRRRPPRYRSTKIAATNNGNDSFSLPALSTLINTNTIIDNVDFLLDFAIIGHCKTGTTFLAHWLGMHPEVTDDLMGNERHYLTRQQPAHMVEYLHSLPGDKLRAYKAPRDVYNMQVVGLLATYFSTAKIIVGVRHPIQYFESFYNYRIAHGNYTMPPAELLLGKCMLDLPTEQDRRERQVELGGFRDQGVCTDGTKYHVHLSYLGKTTEYECDQKYREMLGESEWRERPHVPNKVFVYEDRQLANLSPAFRRDLQVFLGLREPLEVPLPESIADNGYRHEFLDICWPEYRRLRQELLENGRRAAQWIERYFIDAPGVTISEPRVFIDLLMDWKVDPCLVTEKRLTL